MTALRPCGRETCRLCNPLPAQDPPSDTLAELLLGAAFIVVLLFGVLFLLPVMAS